MSETGNRKNGNRKWLIRWIIEQDIVSFKFYVVFIATNTCVNQKKKNVPHNQLPGVLPPFLVKITLIWSNI